MYFFVSRVPLMTAVASWLFDPRLSSCALAGDGWLLSQDDNTDTIFSILSPIKADDYSYVLRLRTSTPLCQINFSKDISLSLFLEIRKRIPGFENFQVIYFHSVDWVFLPFCCSYAYYFCFLIPLSAFVYKLRSVRVCNFSDPEMIADELCQY